MEENQEKKTGENQAERFARWERAYRILREAVEETHLRDFSEYREEDLLNSRWRIYKREYPGDVSLVIFVSGLFGTLHWEFFLIKGAAHVIEEFEKLLCQPYADKLFALSDGDNVDEAVNYHARSLMINYIYFLPGKMYQALNQALDDTIRGYHKNVIDPTYKEHWKSLGLPDDLTLLPDSELQKYDKQLEDLRKIYVGDKRPKLSGEQLDQLAEQYQALRQEYRNARRFHDQSREVFFRSNPAVRDKDAAWREAWSNTHLNMFPSLRPECLELLADLNYQPHELARKHLARLYRYSDEYLKNRLKGLMKKKSRKGKKLKRAAKRRK